MFHGNNSEPHWDKNIQKYSSKLEGAEPKCEIMFSVQVSLPIGNIPYWK